MNQQYKRLILVLVVLFVILGSFIFYLSVPFINGKIMVLATRPIDPMDPFRGQYITINYDISSVSGDALPGSIIYVLLQEDEESIWRYQDYSLTKPEAGDFIKGIVRSSQSGTLRVEYGIEQFFFERGASFSTQNLTIEVKVGSSGQGRITRLLHEGEPIQIEYRKPGLLS